MEKNLEEKFVARNEELGSGIRAIEAHATNPDTGVIDLYKVDELERRYPLPERNTRCAIVGYAEC